MTILDAVRSGKKFKRKGDALWFEPGYAAEFTVAQVLAEDWEIEEKTVEISRSQFMSVVCNKTLGHIDGWNETACKWAKELGLE